MTAELRAPDVLVLGAGPAGIAAAVTAAEAGLSVVVTDEQRQAGGQVYRSPAFATPARPGTDHASGEALRAELAASTVETAFGESIWLAAPGPEIGTATIDRWVRYRPKVLVVATGAYERSIPVDGWTLPGVIGLAGATILLKSQKMLPGVATVVTGGGPLIYAVAAGILELGGRVVAVVDSNASLDWLGALPSMITRSDLLWRGLGWMHRLRTAGVKVYRHHAVTAIYGAEQVSGVAIRPLGALGRPRCDAQALELEADAVAIGQGLLPNSEITRLLGADHRFDQDCQSLVVTRDADLRTSLPSVFAAGDSAGILGAAAAELEGRLAGLAAAYELRAVRPEDFDRRARPLRRRLVRAGRFGRAMARLMMPPSGLIEACSRSTVVCRCEDVTRGQIEDALADHAFDLNQLKSWTRCGMGPCQGRICGDAVMRLAIAKRASGPQPMPWTIQVPIRPVHSATLTGVHTYDDILADLPEPAPWDSGIGDTVATAPND
ncbi:NAD(P)/FAD-dependent oxidoreductase [Pelagibius sp.]|uniref:FAD/NAD(P)-dependent oxidoreductase n=1 Tax=Pelagibius sp. TaxID=1931238 RepID=UPI003BAEC8F3